MNQRLRIIVIAGLMVAAMMLFGTGSAFAEDQTITIENITYTLHDDGTATVSGTDGDLPENITIPEKINEYTVTEIGSNAFERNNDLTRISFPDSVETIGEEAFAFCYSLQEVNFTPESKLKSIGVNAFEFNFALYKIVIPNGVTTIEENAFEHCDNLSQITIPASVTSIGDYAFTETGLQTITFEAGIQLDSIGVCSFASNKAQEITIPASVTSIGEAAFCDSYSLQTVKFEEGTKLKTIGHQAFAGCSGMISFTTPASVTVIDNSAFSRCYALQEVKFEEDSTIQNIGENAFEYCGNLKDIVIPASVTTIENEAFVNSGLSSITFEHGSKLGSIGENAFDSCGNLTDITIPASVTFIGKQAFQSCGLKTFAFEEGCIIPKISYQTFVSCRGLENITIPASVVSIDNGAFFDCEGLQTVVFEPDSALQSIGRRAFYWCQIQKAVYHGTQEQWNTITVGEDNEALTNVLEFDANEPAPNPLEVSGKTANVRYKALKKKTQTLPVSRVIDFTKEGQGEMSYKKESGNKKITINSKSGKITVKKGLKKKTYKVTVTVKAAGNASYLPSEPQTVTFKIRVR